MNNMVLTENMSWKEFDRQCLAREFQCDSNAPLNGGETFEPCLRGCEKLAEDPELLELLRKVYRGEGE